MVTYICTNPECGYKEINMVEIRISAQNSPIEKI